MEKNVVWFQGSGGTERIFYKNFARFRAFRYSSFSILVFHAEFPRGCPSSCQWKLLASSAGILPKEGNSPPLYLFHRKGRILPARNPNSLRALDRSLRWVPLRIPLKKTHKSRGPISEYSSSCYYWRLKFFRARSWSGMETRYVRIYGQGV